MNTATKRFAALLVTLPFRCVSPLPDGTIDASDRPITVYRYALAASSPTPVVPTKGWMAQIGASAYVANRQATCSVAFPEQSTFVAVE